MKVLSHFDKINIKTFKWEDDFKKDLGLDSLEVTVLLTSVETEFTTVFEDRVFENLTNLEQVIKLLQSDHNTL
jgi:acyl carrier protein